MDRSFKPLCMAECRTKITILSRATSIKWRWLTTRCLTHTKTSELLHNIIPINTTGLIQIKLIRRFSLISQRKTLKLILICLSWKITATRMNYCQKVVSILKVREKVNPFVSQRIPLTREQRQTTMRSTIRPGRIVKSILQDGQPTNKRTMKWIMGLKTHQCQTPSSVMRTPLTLSSSSRTLPKIYLTRLSIKHSTSQINKIWAETNNNSQFLTNWSKVTTFTSNFWP